MSAHLSRLRLFQRHLRSFAGAGVWVWDWVHWHTAPRTRSPYSCFSPPTFHTQYPFPPRSLVCGGHTSPHKPPLVVSHNTGHPLSSSPHAHSFVLCTAVVNKNTIQKTWCCCDKLPRRDRWSDYVGEGEGEGHRRKSQWEFLKSRALRVSLLHVDSPRR